MIWIFGPDTDRSRAIERALGARGLTTQRTEDTTTATKAEACGDIVLCVQARKIIPNPPPRRVFVLHDSLLPKYRGCAPLAWQILNGEKEFGVSLIEAVAAVDAGPVIERISVTLKDPTYDEAYDALTPIYTRLVSHHVQDLVAGTYFSQPQPVKGVSYGCRRRPSDSVIFPDTDTSDEAVNIWRASSRRFGFPCMLGACGPYDDLSLRYVVGADREGPTLFGEPSVHRRLTKDSAVFVFKDRRSVTLHFGESYRKQSTTVAI